MVSWLWVVDIPRGLLWLTRCMVGGWVSTRSLPWLLYACTTIEILLESFLLHGQRSWSVGDPVSNQAFQTPSDTCSHTTKRIVCCRIVANDWSQFSHNNLIGLIESSSAQCPFEIARKSKFLCFFRASGRDVARIKGLGLGRKHETREAQWEGCFP